MVYARKKHGGAIRMQEEAAAVKAKMAAAGVDILVGAEHKATYKAVTSSRVDTTALKKDMPDVAARYTKTTETRRFTFA